MEQATSKSFSVTQSCNRQEAVLPPSGGGSFYSRPKLLTQIQEELSETDFLLLELKADNNLYRKIANELDITPYAVRRQLDAVLSRVSRLYSADLFEFAWVLDLVLDEGNGESDFRSLGSRLGIKASQLKFLILLTRDFVKHPVQHYKKRIFRIET